MPTITTVDATWDTAVTMDASELRRAGTTMFLGDGTANGIRGGIANHGPSSLAVTVNGSDQVTVQAGAAVIPAATGLGVYRTSLGAATSAVALSARNATNPRIDLVAIEVNGTAAVVKTIDGTPAASPSAPALPAQHIELARLNVPAVGGGAVTVDSTWRTFATALGGTLYVETAARLPGSGNHKWQRGIALDTGIAQVWNGTAWVVLETPLTAPHFKGVITTNTLQLSGQLMSYPVVEDTHSGWNVGTKLYTTPRPGIWRISQTFKTTAAAPGTSPVHQFRKNGTSAFQAHDVPAAAYTGANHTWEGRCAQGDTLGVWLVQGDYTTHIDGAADTNFVTIDYVRA